MKMLPKFKILTGLSSVKIGGGGKIDSRSFAKTRDIPLQFAGFFLNVSLNFFNSLKTLVVLCLFRSIVSECCLKLVVNCHDDFERFPNIKP
jgi:hypothetical protein